MSAGTLEERLTELEVRLAFLDDTVASLSGSVAAHDRLLQQFQREFAHMRAELGTVRTALSHDIVDEPPPPHY
jgi:SlyX protein